MDEIETVGELLDAWISYKRAKFEPTTLVVVINAIRLLKDRFGDITLVGLKPRHLEQWMSEMQEAGYSVSYIRRLITTMSTAFQFGLRWELVQSNPCVLAEKPKKGTAKVKSPAVATVNDALEYAKATDYGLYALVRLAAMTGARRSELLGLRRDDFDAGMSTITIRRAAVGVKGGLAVLERTKSSRGARTITIDVATGQVLEKYLTAHDHQWIFPSRNNYGHRPVSPSTASHKIKALGRAVGADLHTHALRHFCAMELIGMGYSPTEVAGRLGDSVQTIVSTYLHARDLGDGAAAASMASLID